MKANTRGVGNRWLFSTGALLSFSGLAGLLCGAAMVAFANALGDEAQFAGAQLVVVVSAIVIVAGIAFLLMAVVLSGERAAARAADPEAGGADPRGDDLRLRTR